MKIGPRNFRFNQWYDNRFIVGQSVANWTVCVSLGLLVSFESLSWELWQKLGFLLVRSRSWCFFRIVGALATERGGSRWRTCAEGSGLLIKGFSPFWFCFYTLMAFLRNRFGVRTEERLATGLGGLEKPRMGLSTIRVRTGVYIVCFCLVFFTGALWMHGPGLKSQWSEKIFGYGEKLRSSAGSEASSSTRIVTGGKVNSGGWNAVSEEKQQTTAGNEQRLQVETTNSTEAIVGKCQL